MKTMFLKSAFIIGSVCAVACAAPQAKPSQQGTVKTAAPHHAHTHGAHSNGVKTAPHTQGYMKPGAALSFSHDMKAGLQPGESGQFTLTIHDAYQEGQLEIIASGDKGLNLYATSSNAIFDLAGNEAHIMDVHFDASTAGRHYVTFQALVVSAQGQSSRRTYAVPVIVGDPATFVNKNKGQILVNDTQIGGKVIEMNAKETIDGIER